MLIPHRTPFFLPFLYPTLTWRIPTEKKELYLTFDDGPFPGPTDFVLDQLKKFSAKATFFCIGDNVRKHSSLYRQVVNEGHRTGNHTFNHLNGWKTGLDRYKQNIDECDDVMLKNHPSYRAELFRPPYGKIKRNQIRDLNHYRIIMWDVLTKDYDENLSPERCASNTIAAVRPGSIILFHDSIKAQANMVYALPRVLEHFTGLGFTFKAL